MNKKTTDCAIRQVVQLGVSIFGGARDQKSLLRTLENKAGELRGYT